MTMDESTFLKELQKYKVVRRADHCKIRYNKNKKVAEKKVDKPQASTQSTTDTSLSFPPDATFYDVLAAAPKNQAGIPPNEWNKFVNASKQNQNQILELLNLEDLESLAASLNL